MELRERILAIIFGLVTLTAPLHAQQTSLFPNGSGGSIATGTLATDGQTVALIGITDTATIAIHTSANTWDGQAWIEARYSNTDTWNPVPCFQPNNVGFPLVNSISGSTGEHELMCPAGGYNEFRLRAIGGTTSSMDVIMRGTSAPTAAVVQIANNTAIPVSATFVGGTSSRVRTGDWFGQAFTAGLSSDLSTAGSYQVVRTLVGDAIGSGSMISVGDQVTFTDLGGAASLSALWSNTWTGDVVLEKSIDQNTWELIATINGASAPTTVQTYNVQGYRYFRARATTIASGQADLFGRVSSTPVTMTGGSFSCVVPSTTTATTQCQAAPAAGFKAYVTSVTMSNAAATVQTLDIVYGTGANCGTGTTAITHKVQFGTNATTTSPQFYTMQFQTPLVPAAGNAICVRPSAATAFGATITGYIAP